MAHIRTYTRPLPKFKINDEVGILNNNNNKDSFNLKPTLRFFGRGRYRRIVGRIVSVRPFRLEMWMYRLEGEGIDEFRWWGEGELE